MHEATRLRHPGPADWVTGVRAVLACGVAVLTVASLLGSPHTVALTGMAVVALTLDAVDGWVARRTNTVTPWGARFDMEVDALLIAVLSIHVAAATHWWVLTIGAMRYLFAVAGWLLPWLREPSPPRYFAKVVAAIQGIVLVVAGTGLVPDPWVTLALLAALVLLLESFGRQAWWLLRHRHDAPLPPPEPAAAPAVAAWVAPTIAFVAVWVALAPPRLADGFDVADLLQIPIEGVVLTAAVAVLPAAPRAVLAWCAGLLAAGLAVVRALGVGFHVVLDRPFHVLDDWSYLPKGFDVLQSTEGGERAAMVAMAVVIAVGALTIGLVWATRRVARTAATHRRRALQAAAALATVWIVAAVLPGSTGGVAAARATDLVAASATQIRADFADHTAFAEEIATDEYDGVPADQLLTGLEGRDVLLVWVESYGRVALEASWFAPEIVETLAEGTAALDAAGYESRSAFLTSPTFGAASWLAHATLQSGLRVASERRYRQLQSSDRMSFTSAFDRAGWDTIFTVPANTRDWPEGKAYYGFDRLYDSRNVGYEGPEFGYASMPDQYTLEHFRRTELAPTDRPPVFAEIDLISSHHPWAPLPEPVPWDAVGDGSVFDGMPERGDESVDGHQDPETAQLLYAASIRYTMETIVSFLTTHPDPDRVVILVGDHQPHSFVSGTDPGHDVPVTVLSQDEGVLAGTEAWQWESGLHPSPTAPTWPMEDFRDRFFRDIGGAPN